jgi:hypothetical protein
MPGNRGTRLVAFLSALSVSALLFLRATPATATFPGPDGRIAFGCGNSPNISN